jgi:alcohol dehydrogenase class IV
MVGSFQNFIFAKIPQIIFGIGFIDQLGKIAGCYGRKILLVTGSNSYDMTLIKKRVENTLSLQNLDYLRYPVSGEPSPLIIDEAVGLFKKEGIDAVVAVGGGSVMDAGKAISVMLVTEGNVKDYLEEVGTRQSSGQRLPLIAIPTTSGTGSEATKNAVISEFGDHGFKKSLRHDNYVPDCALIDPELTISCLPHITAASGMDAFTQLLESYLSTTSSTMTDALAISGLVRIARSLKNAYLHGDNLEARTDMSYAALISGITLSNAGLGVIHGFAQPLGSLFPVPHGVVCGTLMGVANRYTVSKLRLCESKTQYLEKYASVGRLFSDDQSMSKDYYIDLLLHTIEEYIEEFKIPRLSVYHIYEDNLDDIVAQTGIKNHPVAFYREELKEMVRSRL